MNHIRVLTVTDLHQIGWMYIALEAAVAEHKPDVLVLVGDFLHGGIPKSCHYTARECASRLAGLPCEVVFVRGNHETDNWEPFVERWLESGRPLHIPHGDAVALGPLVLVGFPCGFAHEKYFLMGRPDTFDAEKWLPKVWEQYGPAALSLWLMHEPPARTKLCEEEGLMAGLEEWRTAIEKYQPWLTVSGHDHETPVFDGFWRDQIGRTTCINTGQPARLTQKTKILHYCVMDFEFAGLDPSLPKSVTVTAYPWRESLTLPSATKIGKPL
jgi:Icc-related predicted phosphoesterase